MVDSLQFQKIWWFPSLATYIKYRLSHTCKGGGPSANLGLFFNILWTWALVWIAQGTSTWWGCPFCEEKEKSLRCAPPPLHLHQIFTTHGFPWDVSLGTSSFVWWNFTRNWDKIFDIWKVSDLEGFYQLLEIRQRKEKNRQISILVFSFIATVNTEDF